MCLNGVLQIAGVVAGMGKAQGQAAPVNNRRALGDIGNLVGAAACPNASKEGQIEYAHLPKFARFIPIVWICE